MDDNLNNDVARIILEQLGGNRFIAMTGAKNLHGHSNFLSFRIPRAKQGIQYVKITLTPLDLYNIEFAKFKKFDFEIIKEINGVYFDQLREVFERETGLATSLGEVHVRSHEREY